jgi:hypothetical protein
MAATFAAMQALWLRSLLAEITAKEPQVVKLFVDNNSAIALMKNPMFHGRSKHIDIKYHFIRESMERGQIAVKRVCTEEQKADALTKPFTSRQTCCHEAFAWSSRSQWISGLGGRLLM